MSEQVQVSFDDGARRVLSLAQREALRMNQQRIDGLHLLLAIYQYFVEKGVDTKIFGRLPGGTANLRALVEQRLGHGQALHSGELPPTDEVRMALTAARAQAHLKEGSAVTPILLLSALLDESEGVEEFLSTLGCDVARIRIAAKSFQE